MSDGPGFRGEHLRRVIVVPEGRGWLEGWKIQSVALYADGVVVRAWRANGFDDDDDLSDLSDLWMIEDDLGTRYGYSGGGGSCDEGTATQDHEFSGAVPEAATALTIHGRQESIQVELSSVA